MVLQNAVETGTTILNGVVTSEMLSGVLNEVIGLLPVCIPVIIGFAAIRKGISFIQSTLLNA